jgi:hypothetical protein
VGRQEEEKRNKSERKMKEDNGKRRKKIKKIKILWIFQLFNNQSCFAKLKKHFIK